MVSPSSWALETMPRPLRNATTGASIISASSRISSQASMAPAPTKIIGVLLPDIMAAALAEERGRHLAGQAQHRLVATECGEQGRTRIEHAGAGHHAEHAGPAG